MIVHIFIWTQFLWLTLWDTKAGEYFNDSNPRQEKILLPWFRILMHGSNFLFTLRYSLVKPSLILPLDEFDDHISPLHVGISLRSTLKDTLSGSLSVTLADESWKSPIIEDKKIQLICQMASHKENSLLKCSYISGSFDLIQGITLFS